MTICEIGNCEHRNGFFHIRPQIEEARTTQLILGTFRFGRGPLKYLDKRELCRLRPISLQQTHRETQQNITVKLS